MKPRSFDVCGAMARRVRAAAHHASRGQASEQDTGLLAYAYSVTRSFAYRYLASKPTRDLIDRLGIFFHGSDLEAFREVWREEKMPPP